MFEKILVANRGEIACRIERTARRLGIKTVAVYSEADRFSRHVLDADESVCLGAPPPSQSYLRGERIIAAALDKGAQAIHPGYGFLSESPDFAEAVESAGLKFIGPTPAQIRQFGTKHGARALAREVGVPLLPGTEIVESREHAERAALEIGLPVLIKSTAGGGGIGMQICRSLRDLPGQLALARELATKNFGDGRVFLEKFVERARHVEVQLFGDGNGQVVALGERDCSLQRRHQKVLEEAPAPGLSEQARTALIEAALKLGRAVRYRSAGTVEFIHDDESGESYFLEVNTRLQVEHPVTECVWGLDLVEWMLRCSAGEVLPISAPRPHGHAIEVRLYAEDPARAFRPSAGLLTEVRLPETVRVDTFVETGTEVSAFYDPLIAKIIAHGADRAEALARLQQALDDTRIGGVETNRDLLACVTRSPEVTRARVTTSLLGSMAFSGRSIEVLAPGTLTTVQQYPGRIGYWDVGIPPSGPFDSLHCRLANRLVGNAESAPALEVTMTGPTLAFATDTVVAISGAKLSATLDGLPFPNNRANPVRAGQVLALGSIQGPGARAYVAVEHGLRVPGYLGSAATFTLGGFGGHGGRALRKGDVLHIGAESDGGESAAGTLEKPGPWELQPLSDEVALRVVVGPHADPDFFTSEDMDVFFRSEFEVHYNSSRTGVRLIGPRPAWARADGGEAGLHPSNIHDCPYAVGAVDFTGDMPIILGPDGPSLGGFVCPATVIAADLWKVGQLRAGSKVRFEPVDVEQAVELEAAQRAWLERPSARHPDRGVTKAASLPGVQRSSAIVGELDPDGERPRVQYRASGDHSLLVEYGPMVLDLKLRFRVHALQQWLKNARVEGVIDVTPGIRSLQVHHDGVLSRKRLLALLKDAENELPSVGESVVPTRVVHLPLSWDDPATRLAIEKYSQLVRRDAPWAPSNIEFIRRINGLTDEQAVRDIVFGASYLVLGLGDVYLGAPVATPIDPRHRLVTTKYNPARTWTPENAVGIGGAYLCIYGMEGPGGYQFVGRTVQVFNRFRQSRWFEAGKPWLLRFFDQIRFYPVGAAELLELRDAFAHGRFDPRVEEEPFRLADYEAFLKREAASIQVFKGRQQAAFDEERRRWAAGDSEHGSPETHHALSAERRLPHDGGEVVESHVHGSVWQVRVRPGEKVAQGDVLIVLEAMKMEIVVEAPCGGTVSEILAQPGETVAPGQGLVVMRGNE